MSGAIQVKTQQCAICMNGGLKWGPREIEGLKEDVFLCMKHAELTQFYAWARKVFGDAK